MGLRRSRMCHSTWQASMHRKTWARTRGASLGELVAVFDTTHGTRDLVLTGGAAAAGDLVGQLAHRRLGGLQQILALAGPFLGQERVLADHEPLAGKLGCGDLSQIAFVE